MSFQLFMLYTYMFRSFIVTIIMAYIATLRAKVKTFV
jgi:hypothetical protein